MLTQRRIHSAFPLVFKSVAHSTMPHQFANKLGNALVCVHTLGGGGALFCMTSIVWEVRDTHPPASVFYFTHLNTELESTVLHCNVTVCPKKVPAF
uniref:Uncharacterized protein n=1 Tax=Anguilla anguilla TaxID=7936 RepID=A0A0E9WJ22_ANGAN